MQGYYCIYDSGNDRWWGVTEYWIDHRMNVNKSIPSGYEINTHSLGSGTVELKLLETEWTTIDSLDSITSISPNSIMKFNSVSETDNYILTYDWSTNILTNSFLSIRKIYY